MQFAILVSVIVAVLLGSFLTLTKAHQLFKIQSGQLLNAIEDTNLGISYGNNAKHIFIDSVSIPFQTEKKGHTNLKRKFWGGFQLLESESSFSSNKFKKLALTGGVIPSPNTSILVSDSRVPLVVVGDTKIEGTAYISDKGIKPGIISGNYYTGTKLIDGLVHYGSQSLPNLREDWLIHIKNLESFIPMDSDFVIPIKEENKNSFFNPTQTIYQREPLIVNETYIGNITLKSETEIIVTKNAKLTDVTLIAPIIIIEKGFSGSASFIASESVLVEEDVILSYPSAIIATESKVVNPNPNLPINVPITISKNSSVSGVVVYLRDKKKAQTNKKNTKVNIAIDTGAIIEGQVYCQGNTQVSGTVIGSIFTSRFVFKGFGSVYINHIFNGKILAKNLNKKYCGLPFSSKTQGTIKWLY